MGLIILASIMVIKLIKSNFVHIKRYGLLLQNKPKLVFRPNTCRFLNAIIKLKLVN
jgi:hypothetical protein